MYPSTAADMADFQAHQRKIVRHFAPHLSNAALRSQERIYFALSLAHIALVWVLPSCAIFYLHDAFIETPVFALVCIVCVIELALAMYRFFVLWPEGLRMRWNYWHEVKLNVVVGLVVVQSLIICAFLQIELSEDCYKLKILGYYHRKIEKFVGRFPLSMSSSQIHVYYRRHSMFLLTLFTGSYVTCLVLLLQLTFSDAATRMWVLYALSIASALVVLRIVKMHLIELPQVLALRSHPEFAVDLMRRASTEAIPFARPVPTYEATADERISAPIVEVEIDKTSQQQQLNCV